MNKILFVFIHLILVSLALAQVQVQPTQVIEATPIESFSERTGAWNYSEHLNEIYSQDAQPLQNNLNYLPGVQARANGSPTVSIRGSSQSTRVLSLYDGVPLLSGAGTGTPFILLPQENLHRTLLVKSASSVQYGSSAMAGAVNFNSQVLRRPTVRVGLGSYDSPGHGLDQKNLFFGAPLLGANDRDQHLQATIYMGGDTGRYNYTLGSNGKSGDRRDNYSELQRYTLSGHHRKGLLRFQETFVLAREIRKSPGSYYSPYPADNGTLASLVSLAVSTKAIRNSELSFRTSGVFEDAREQANTPGLTTQARQYTQSLGYRYLGEDVQPEVFVDWKTSTLRASYTNDQLYTENQVETGFQLQIPTQGWIVQPGVRYLTGFGKALTSFGAFREHQGQKTWITYSEGYRTPTLTDRYGITLFYEGNPSLKPEFSQTVEIGYANRAKYDPLFKKEGLLYGGSLYRTRYRDLIESESSTVLRKVNRGEATSQGVGLNAGYALSVWTVEGSSEFMEAVDDKAQRPLRLAPRQKHSIATTYQLGPFITELRYLYWSSYVDQRFPAVAGQSEWVELGPWRTWDFNVRTIGFTNWIFRAGILNLLNEQRELTYGYPEPGRQVYLSAQRFF